MLESVRLISAIAGGLAGVGMALLSIYLAEYSPADDKAKGAFVFAAAFACVVWVVAVFAFAICEHRLSAKRDQRENERDSGSREMMALLASLVKENTEADGRGVNGSANSVATSATLRVAGLQMAKEMREFANANDGSGDLLMKQFWDAFPFKSYDDLKERFKLHLGPWEVEPSSTILPTTPERIRRLADNIERESSRIPADIPL